MATDAVDAFKVSIPLLGSLIGCNSEAEARWLLRDCIQGDEKPSVEFEVAVRSDGTRVKCALVTAAHSHGELDTDYTPKELTRVLGIPLIVHCLQHLANAGILHVVLVVAENCAGSTIVQEVNASGIRRKLDVSFVSMPTCTNHVSSIIAARRLLPPEFIFVAGDHVFSYDLIESLVRKPLEENEAGRLAVELDIDRHKGLPHTAVYVRCDESHVLAIARSANLDSEEEVAHRSGATNLKLGLEAGLMLLTQEVMEAVIDLSCIQPHCTLANALADFAHEGRLRYVSTLGASWLACETRQQLSDIRSGLFEQFEQTARSKVASPTFNAAVSSEAPPPLMLTCWQSEDGRPDLPAAPTAAMGSLVPIKERASVPLSRRLSDFINAVKLPRYSRGRRGQHRLADDDDRDDGDTVTARCQSTVDAPATARCEEDTFKPAIAAHLDLSETSEIQQKDFLLRLPPLPNASGVLGAGGSALAVVPPSGDKAPEEVCTLPSGVEHVELATVSNGTGQAPGLVALVHRRTPPVAWLMLAFGLYCGASFGQLVDMQDDVPPILRTCWLFTTISLMVAPVAVFSFGNATRAALRVRSVWLNISAAAVCHAAGLSLMAAAFALTTFTQVLVFSSAAPLFVVLLRIVQRIPISGLEWTGTILAVAAAMVAPFTSDDDDDVVMQAVIIGAPAANATGAAETSSGMAIIEGLGKDTAGRSVGNMILGDVLACLCAALDAAYYVFAKQVRNQVPLSVFFLLLFSLGAAGLAVAAVAAGEVRIFADLRQLIGWAAPTKHLYLTVLTAGAELGAMGNFVFVLKYVRPLTVTVVVLLQPVVATVQGLVLGTMAMPGLLSVASNGVMLAGVGLVAAGGRENVEEVNLNRVIKPLHSMDTCATQTHADAHSLTHTHAHAHGKAHGHSHAVDTEAGNGKGAELATAEGEINVSIV